PTLDFGVVGLGQPGDFPAWIKDMRSTSINDELEQKWCQQYAASHITIGVHGSNMLLPSAHAGSVINLMPNERWGNCAQDIIHTGMQTGREIMIRYRFLLLDSSPDAVSKTAIAMLYQIP